MINPFPLEIPRAHSGILAATLSQMQFTWTGTGTFTGTIRGATGEKVTVYWGDGTLNTYTLTGTGTDNTITHTYSGAGAKKIRITNPAALTKFNVFNHAPLSGSTSEFNKLISCRFLDFRSTGISGTLGFLNYLDASADVLRMENCTGDFSPINRFKVLEDLHTRTVSPSSGSISDIDAATTLKQYDGQASGIGGSVAHFSGNGYMLTRLWLNGSPVTGNYAHVGSIAGLQSFQAGLQSGSVTDLYPLTGTLLRLALGSATGRIEDLAAFTAITDRIQANNTSIRNYTSGTSWPAWNNIRLEMQNNLLASADVDNILDDLAASGLTNCIIRLDNAGSGGAPNSARTSASDAAVATLVAAGNTVHVLE